MPKRVYGICPLCGRVVGKRGGKLKDHFPTRPSLAERDEPCPGGGKGVPNTERR